MFILKALSYVSLFFIKLRIFLYRVGIFKSYKIEGLKIISIGNLAMGGTGKTPATIAIGQNLIEKGFRIAVLLRGYKRKNIKEIIMVHDGEKIVANPEKSGDEAYLIARKLSCPVMVSKDRVKGAELIKKEFNPDFLLLDDGFQHLRLKRDKDIVLVTQKSLENRIYVFPAQKFREPLSHLKRADVIIITKIHNAKNIKKNIIKLKKINKPVYLGNTELISFTNAKTGETLATEELSGKECVIFSGLAQPEYFEQILLENNIKIIDKLEFPDHYRYREKDYKKLNKFRESVLITTEKDIVKIDVTKLKSETILTANIKYSFHKT